MPIDVEAAALASMTRMDTNMILVNSSGQSEQTWDLYDIAAPQRIQSTAVEAIPLHTTNYNSPAHQ